MKKRHKHVLQSTCRAFTLVELLVVIAIISVLAALLLPALEGALVNARLVACKSQMKQQYQLTLLYTEDHDGCLPDQDQNFNFNHMLYYNGKDSSYGGSAPRLVNMGLYAPYLENTVDLFYCPSRGFTADGKAAWQAIVNSGFTYNAKSLYGHYSVGWEYGYHSGQGKYVGYPTTITPSKKPSIDNYAKTWRLMIADQNHAPTGLYPQLYPHNSGAFLNVVHVNGAVCTIYDWGPIALKHSTLYSHLSNTASWKFWWMIFGPGEYEN